MLLLMGLAACSAAANAEPAATPAPAATQAASGTTTVAATEIHVGDLLGTAVNLGNTWQAQVLVSVVDSNGSPAMGVLVEGTWDEGDILDSSCETDDTGQCELTSGDIIKKVKEATLVIAEVTHPQLPYQPANDHDPDPLGDGTSVRVPKS